MEGFSTPWPSFRGGGYLFTQGSDIRDAANLMGSEWSAFRRGVWIMGRGELRLVGSRGHFVLHRPGFGNATDPSPQDVCLRVLGFRVRVRRDGVSRLVSAVG